MEAEFSDECQRRLGYHPVGSDKQKAMYEENRRLFMELYDHLVARYSPSRELSLALTELQNSLMWVNAHVACNDVGIEGKASGSLCECSVRSGGKEEKEGHGFQAADPANDDGGEED